jgi:hypothetical protein
MKNYLSFGGGVNSVAMYLLLMEQGLEPGNADNGFEAVYVWMPDWPETHEYLMMMEYKEYPVTVVTSANTVKGTKEGNLYEYAWLNRMMPQRNPRWCTSKFKIKTLIAYQKPPAFVNIGISMDESHRAKMSNYKGFEHRFPLIENEIDRNGCVEIIKTHGLPIPIKSGCFICPFQRVSQLKQLRRKHPQLFCKLVELERRNAAWRISKGLPLYYNMKKPIEKIVNEPDRYLFEEMAYPPCECGL